MREGSVPGPRIGPHDPDALPGQKERRLLSHATSFVQEIGASIGCPRRRVHENDIERLQLRSEEHTSELQSLMRISYAVFCLKKKKQPLIQSQYPSPSNNTHKT